MGAPSTESAEVRLTTWSEVTLPETTWYRRTCFRAAGSASRVSSVPAGRAAKAASVGAKTVNGPGPCSVSTNPAAVAALSRVPNEPAALAVATMSPAGAMLSAGAEVAGAGVAGAGVDEAVLLHAATRRASGTAARRS